MKSLVAVMAVVAVAIVFPPTARGLYAQDKDTKDRAAVAGQWTLNVKSPHGEVGMALDLKQDGSKVTGTLATPHGDNLPVEGEFAAGTVTLATAGSSDARITMTAKLKDDGTLDGYLSSQMGDMTWTARRTAPQ